eukprot:PhF_6_TR19697/c0_g1_i1/m.28761
MLDWSQFYYDEATFRVDIEQNQSTAWFTLQQNNIASDLDSAVSSLLGVLRGNGTKTSGLTIEEEECNNICKEVTSIVDVQAAHEQDVAVQKRSTECLLELKQNQVAELRAQLEDVTGRRVTADQELDRARSTQSAQLAAKKAEIQSLEAELTTLQDMMTTFMSEDTTSAADADSSSRKFEAHRAVLQEGLDSLRSEVRAFEVKLQGQHEILQPLKVRINRLLDVLSDSKAQHAQVEKETSTQRHAMASDLTELNTQLHNVRAASRPTTRPIQSPADVLERTTPSLASPDPFREKTTQGVDGSLERTPSLGRSTPASSVSWERRYAALKDDLNALRLELES